jgi:hypothetical protein
MLSTPDIDMASETNVDVEIVEEGKTAGPVPSAIKGQSDLEPATYQIGRSIMTEVVLDEYVERGLLKVSLHSLCHAPNREEVPQSEPYEAVVFCDFFEARLRFPCADFISEVLQCFNL